MAYHQGKPMSPQRRLRLSFKPADADHPYGHAKVEAERLGKEAEKEMEAALKRREAAALEKIAQAEAKALAEVRGQAVDVCLLGCLVNLFTCGFGSEPRRS